MQLKSPGMDPVPGTVPYAEDPEIIRWDFCCQAAYIVQQKESKPVWNPLGGPSLFVAGYDFIPGQKWAHSAPAAPENQTALKTGKIVR